MVESLEECLQRLDFTNITDLTTNNYQKVYLATFSGKKVIVKYHIKEKKDRAEVSAAIHKHFPERFPFIVPSVNPHIIDCEQGFFTVQEFIKEDLSNYFEHKTKFLDSCVEMWWPENEQKRAKDILRQRSLALDSRRILENLVVSERLDHFFKNNSGYQQRIIWLDKLINTMPIDLLASDYYFLTMDCLKSLRDDAENLCKSRGINVSRIKFPTFDELYELVPDKRKSDKLIAEELVKSSSKASSIQLKRLIDSTISFDSNLLKRIVNWSSNVLNTTSKTSVNHVDPKIENTVLVEDGIYLLDVEDIRIVPNVYPFIVLELESDLIRNGFYEDSLSDKVHFSQFLDEKYFTGVFEVLAYGRRQLTEIEKKEHLANCVASMIMRSLLESSVPIQRMYKNKVEQDLSALTAVRENYYAKILSNPYVLGSINKFIDLYEQEETDLRKLQSVLKLQPNEY